VRGKRAGLRLVVRATDVQVTAPARSVRIARRAR
jgi:hypothetical protein